MRKKEARNFSILCPEMPFSGAWQVIRKCGRQDVDNRGEVSFAFFQGEALRNALMDKRVEI